MIGTVRDVLASIRTVTDMVAAFQDEERCQRLLEAMIWARGRICPACGCKDSTALAGRDIGRWARPGLYQCCNRECRFQFTVTTRTPLHATKLPLRVWLSGLWLILQSDKRISSVGLAEAIGVSQPTAWRMGHALRLLVAGEYQLDGTVEIDEFYIGGTPAKMPVGRILGEDAKANPGRRRRQFGPSSKGRHLRTWARRRAEPGRGSSPIYPNVRCVGCWVSTSTSLRI